MSGDSLGDRMKGYEDAGRAYLPRRMPVIIRVDGKAFHTFTRGMERPFDAGLENSMNQVAIAMCEEMQGASLAYIQSDEISIFLHNYRALETQPWFENNIQKMVSISASIASATISLIYGKNVLFDSRAFILPEAELANYFIWRQQDATRNSLQMLARSHFSHSALLNKNSSQMHEMLFEKGINWNDLPTYQKRGRCAKRVEFQVEMAIRNRWEIDREIPIFTQDREYIEKHLK